MMRLSAVVGALLLVALSPVSASAAPIMVSFDTSSLIGAGDFAFAADLIDGDGISNTTITLDLFDLGGGGAVGGPTLVGGAAGSLGGAVTLTDTDFFNSFVQSFTPGATLGFRLDFATTALGVPQPEGFQFAILDASGFPVATTDPSGFNALIFGELAATGSSFDQFQLAPSVPEPATFLLLLVGGGGAMLKRRWAERTVST